MKFKIGDIVRIKEGCKGLLGRARFIGLRGEVAAIDKLSNFSCSIKRPYGVRFAGVGWANFNARELEKID